MLLKTGISTYIPVQLSTLGNVDCNSECRSRDDSRGRDGIAGRRRFVVKKKNDERREFVLVKSKTQSQ